MEKIHCVNDDLITKQEDVHDDDYDTPGLKGIIKNPYLFGIALFSSLGGLLFGYDQGVISGIQDMENFKQRFPMTPMENGFVVSILELGAWLGSFLIAYLADAISRKYSIAVASIFFLIGSALQAGAQQVIHLLIGRFIAGLGVGSLSMLGPLYQSELSSTNIRGSIVSIYHLSTTLGVALSFWIDYGASFAHDETSWRLPLYIQMVFGLILLIGVYFLPFSPRWLVKAGREQEALHVLARLRRRPQDNRKVKAEWNDIKVAVAFDRYLEQHIDSTDVHTDHGGSGCFYWLGREWRTYCHVLGQGMWKRIMVGGLLLFFQQFTGVNAIVYYAPFIINSVGITGDAVKLLATGVIGVIMVCCCIPTVLFLDKVGRKLLLLVGSVGMCICMTTMASLTTAFQHDWIHHTTEGWISVTMIYIFMGLFACSWGPVCWVLTSELFPLRVRAKAMGITSSSHWMNNFIVGFITPPLLASNPHVAYFMFGGFCFISFGFVWFFIPETKGCSLEDLDQLFGSQTAAEDAATMKRIQHEVNAATIATTPFAV
ncbi:general substrate transporter [Absidia repens]|uniref:General substrate transporter n=1 Tax=Absidia repens TaxID=90262 RepID=A0A1X2IHU6_9FUNG|nr:general substrate transporter [Absidia repens]